MTAFEHADAYIEGADVYVTAIESADDYIWNVIIQFDENQLGTCHWKLHLFLKSLYIQS